MTPLEILALSFRPLAIPRRVDRDMPRLCGIYVLAGRSRIHYIGQSTDILQRLNAHRSDQKRRQQTRSSRALWYPIPEGCLKYYEGALIRALRPEFNFAAPPHFGYDNEILDGFGLPVHLDERANHHDWLAVQHRRRTEDRRRSDARIEAFHSKRESESIQ